MVVSSDFLTPIIEADTHVFLSLNGVASPFWDSFMSIFTGKFTWIPMYTAILYVLFRNFHWRVVLCYMAAIILTIFVADQLCSSIIRPAVERLRPSNLANPISSMVHIVDGYRGGPYGFPSCHAANSFGLAAVVAILCPKRWLCLFIFVWALLNSYSRIYLGVHYPGDLIAGAIIGGFGGWFFGLTVQRLVPYAFPNCCGPQHEELQEAMLPVYAGFFTLLFITIYSLLQLG